MLARFRTLILSLGVAAAALTVAPPALAQADDEPLARFEDPLCPGVAGLRRDAAEAMVGRIRANAEMLGLRLAADGACSANLVVAFVDDGQAYLTRMMDGNGYAFGDMSLAERHALLEAPGPVHVLQRVIPRSRDGLPIPRHESLNDVPQTWMWMAHSKIYSATQNDIQYALVLIDRGEIAGIGVGQLADYASFVGLAKLLPRDREGSILALFDGPAERPTGLTEFDRAYLTALYDGLPNLPGPVRVAHLEAATGRDIFN